MGRRHSRLRQATGPLVDILGHIGNQAKTHRGGECLCPSKWDAVIPAFGRKPARLYICIHNRLYLMVPALQASALASLGFFFEPFRLPSDLDSVDRCMVLEHLSSSRPGQTPAFVDRCMVLEHPLASRLPSDLDSVDRCMVLKLLSPSKVDQFSINTWYGSTSDHVCFSHSRKGICRP